MNSSGMAVPPRGPLAFCYFITLPVQDYPLGSLHQLREQHIALFLSLLVASASTDGEVGTEQFHGENSSNTEDEITSPATPKPCEIPRIDVVPNARQQSSTVKVAKRCACNVEVSSDPDDYYGDEDDFDDPEMEVVRWNSGPHKVETKSEVESIAADVPMNATVPTKQPSGPSEITGMVKDGTPCVIGKTYFGEKVVTGVCHKGHCDRTNKTTFTILTTRRPPYNPLAYHCKVNTTFINNKLEVALGCMASCYLEENNGTWNETGLDDGRLCALDIGSGNGEYIKRTGVCRSGSCVKADFTPWTHPNGCVEATTRRNGHVLAVRCTDYCNNNTRQRLPDGTPCLLNHERMTKVPPHVPSLIVEGICKNGRCIITPPTVPVMMVNVPEEGCSHFLSSVSYTEKVEASCSRLCSSKYKSVERGTHCALKTAGKWPMVTEVGQCVDGECLDKVPDSPPPHKLVDPTNRNCKSIDYLTVVPGKLLVVVSCKIECSYGKFENRKDGVNCLLEYNAQRTKAQPNGQQGTYVVGVCKSGYCTLGKHSLNTTTQD